MVSGQRVLEVRLAPVRTMAAMSIVDRKRPAFEQIRQLGTPSARAAARDRKPRVELRAPARPSRACRCGSGSLSSDHKRRDARNVRSVVETVRERRPRGSGTRRSSVVKRSSSRLLVVGPSPGHRRARNPTVPACHAGVRGSRGRLRRGCCRDLDLSDVATDAASPPRLRQPSLQQHVALSMQARPFHRSPDASRPPPSPLPSRPSTRSRPPRGSPPAQLLSAASGSSR